MKRLHNFPLKDCKQHSFCQYPSTEDQATSESIDLKHYLHSMSPFKKLDLREREIISISSMPNEFDFRYLKSIEEQMDGINSVKPGIPIVTEEGLSDWCQQSMNRRLPVIPPTRPFLMPKAIYDYLKSVQELTKEHSNAVPNDKELMTVAEINTLIEKQTVPIHKLQPRTMENGTPFIYPRYKNKKKAGDSVNFSISELPKQKAKIKTRPSTVFNPEYSKQIKARVEQEERKDDPNSGYKLDVNFARQVLEITRKKIKFFQNLAFSSVFLNKIMEKDKHIHITIPVEFTTPLIEQKDIQDFPVIIEFYCRPYWKPNSINLQDSFNLLASGKWLQASQLFKHYLKSNIDCIEAQYGLAISLERQHCYKLSRKWLVESLKLESDNPHVLFGLAVLSFKLNELGSCIYFCKKTLENNHPQEPGYFFYSLALAYRKLNSLVECNNYYQSLVELLDNKMSIYIGASPNDWDEQAKTLVSWMQSRTDIPFFRRFKSKQLKSLCHNKIKKVEAMGIYLLQPGTSYVVLKGSLRIRDHSTNYTLPTSIWKVQAGHYINYSSHKDFYEGMQYWMIAEVSSYLLEVPADMFTALARELRTNKEVVNMHLLHSFPIFKDIFLETLEALVLESMKIKKCHKGQIVRKRITDRKFEKKNLFGVIITGICDLKREDGLDLAIIGRGDCFGEEFIFNDLQGFASLGNLVVRTDNLEVGFISPQDLLRLPEYELSKIESNLKTNPHIRRCMDKVNSSFNSHTRWQSTRY